MELSVNALEAAVCVAERLGLSVEEPVLLRSTNNVVAWLRPSMIVAKIGVGQQRGFHTEVSVASELAALSAPNRASGARVSSSRSFARGICGYLLALLSAAL